MSDIATVARRGAWSLVFRLTQAILGFLVIVVTARGFGAEGRGLYALTTLASALSVIPLSGTILLMMAELAHRRSMLSELYAASLLVGLFGGGIIAVCMGAAAALAWPAWSFLVFAAAAAPFLLLSFLQADLYSAQGDIRRMGFLNVSLSLTTLLFVGVVAIVDAGNAYAALAAWAAAQALVATITAFAQYKQAPFQLHGVLRFAGRLVRRGIPVSLANGLLQLNLRIDVFVVAALLDLKDVGIYSVAVAIGEVLWQISRAVGTGAAASIITLPTADSAQLTTRALRHSSLLLIVSGVACILGVAALAGSVLGNSFAGVWLILALLTPGIIARGGEELLVSFLTIRLERRRDFLTAASVGLTLNLTLALALVPYFGIQGAAISTSVSYLASAAYIFFRFRRLTGLRSPATYVFTRKDFKDYLRFRAP